MKRTVHARLPLRRLAGGLLALCAWTAAAEDELRLEASVNREQLFVSESVDLAVVVHGDTSAQPDLSALPPCDMQYLGSRSASSFNLSLTFNGREIRREGGSSRTHTYRITPRQPGRLTLGPIRAKAGGKTFSIPGPQIQVDGIEAQEDVLLSITPSKESVLIDEPFEIVLTVAIRRLPPPYDQVDPLDPSVPPHLDVPFLNLDPIEGLETPDMRALLGAYVQNNRNGASFTLNEHTVGNNDPFGGMFPMFNDRQTARFRFDRSEVERNGKRYYAYALKVRYVPHAERSHTFGPAIFKGTIIAGADARGQGVGKRIFAVGPAATVRVVPPPEEGRPDTFIGALGTNLTVEASLDTQTCKVGDPLTLTLTVGGTFRPETVHPPALGRHAALTRDFRVYDDTVQTSRKDGHVAFTYTLRPTREGTYELPPLSVAYYDTQARAYRTVQTRPIPIRANAAAQVGGDIILGLETNRPPETALASQSGVLVVGPLTMDPSGADETPLTGLPAALWLAAGGPACCALVLAGRGARRGIRRLAALRRQRNGLLQARHLLAGVQRGEGDVGQAQGVLADALRRYLVYRFSVPAAVTPSDFAALIRAGQVDATLAEPFREPFERHFNASFAAATGAPAEDARAAAGELLERMARCEAAARRKPTAPAVTPPEDAP